MKNKLCILLSVFILLIGSLCCATTCKAQDNSTTEVTLEDLKGKRAGVLSGTPQDQMVEDNIEDAQIFYYNNFSDIALALETGKIDFYVNSTVAYRIMHETYPDYIYVDTILRQFNIGSIFQKNDEGQILCNEFNTYISKISNDGTLDSLKEYWLYPNDWENFEIPTNGEKGTIKLAVCSANTPFAMVLNGEYAGFDVAIIAGFAKEYGYGLEIEDTDFAGMLAGITAGKYDMAAGQLAYTDERAEKVLYSDFYCTQDIVPIVKASDFGIDTSQVTVTLDDLAGKRAGVISGTPQDEMVEENIKDAKINYYNNFADIALALDTGKIDFYVNSTIAYRMMKDTYPDNIYVDSILRQFNIGSIFPKTDSGQALCEEFNEYISKISEDGTLDSLKEYWLYPNDWENFEIPESGENGVIKLGVCSSNTPFVMMLNNEYAGFDVAIIAGFAKEYGYGLEIEDTDFSGMLSGIATSKYDMAAGQISYTDQRAEKVLYSDFYCTQDIVPIIKASDFGIDVNTEDKQNTFFDSFKRTF